MSSDELLTVADALDLVLAAVSPLPECQVALSAAVGRVLATDIAADMDMPPFPRCAMDGFALRAADVEEPPTSLRVIGTQAAGGVYPDDVGPLVAQGFEHHLPALGPSVFSVPCRSVADVERHDADRDRDRGVGVLCARILCAGGSGRDQYRQDEGEHVVG